MNNDTQWAITHITKEQCYNHRHQVVSLHKTCELAYKSKNNGYIVEVPGHIKRGDEINDNGELWVSA